MALSLNPDSEAAAGYGVVSSRTGGGTPAEKLRNLASQQRRTWVNSSRRFVESMRGKPPRDETERKRAQERLYSGRREHNPRVYA